MVDGLYGEVYPIIEYGRRRDQLQRRIGNETGFHCKRRRKRALEIADVTGIGDGPMAGTR